MTAQIPGNQYSKGAKKRARKLRSITLPGGESAKSRATGRDRRHTNQPDNEPPPIHAARARLCALDAGNVLHESDMGRCILALSSGQERADLSDVWAALSAARRNYRLRCIGQSGSPQGAAIGMIPEPMQTDPSLRVDLRTPDERDAAAKRAWAEWQARIAALPTPQHIWALRGALDGFMGEGRLWDGQPTRHGVSAVAALKLLTERQ